MENYIVSILLIPIVWYVVMISYQLIKLFKLWINYKLQNIKELRIWD